MYPLQRLHRIASDTLLFNLESNGVTRAVGKIVASQIAVWDEAHENGPSYLVPPLTIVAVGSRHSPRLY